MSFGAGILALGEISRSGNQARRAENQAVEIHNQYSAYVFKAKSHVHGARSIIHAHKVTEDMLIAALQAENANHPLASREAVDVAVEKERVKALTNPDVIKRTYPDGKLPNDCIGGDPPASYVIA